MAELFAYLDGFGTSGGFTKSIIIVTGLQTGSVVTANGWTKNAAFAEPNCAEEAYKSLFSNVRFENVPVGTKTTLVVVIYAAEKSRCYLQEDIGFGSRQYFDLKPGDNYIKIPVTTVGELQGSGVTGVFYKVDDTVQVCGKQMRLYTQEVEKIAIEKNGEWWLKNLDIGEWTINASIENQSTSVKYNIDQFGVYRVTMAYQLYPDDFEWSGTKGVDYEIVQDDDTVIPVEDYRRYLNWKARILTTITITPQKNGYVDVFALGGGGSGGFSGNSGPAGSGGGSGYAITYKKVFVEANVPITITIGAGGTYPTTDTKGNDGGETSFGELKAAGGMGGGNQNNPGGNGGSGGNGKWADETRPEERGIDGSDGYKRGTSSSSTEPGKGQKNQSGPNGETGNTREFGDLSGKLYAYGGYASGTAAAKPKEANTGDGGDSGGNTKVNNGAGSSGIVVFRNAREGVA